MEEEPNFHSAYEQLLERLKNSRPISDEVSGIKLMDNVPIGVCFNFNIAKDTFEIAEYKEEK
jgi:hypothetical protein